MCDDYFDFATAITLLKGNKRVARKGWNGKNMWIMAQLPDENSKMTHLSSNYIIYILSRKACSVHNKRESQNVSN